MVCMRILEIVGESRLIVEEKKNEREFVYWLFVGKERKQKKLQEV